MNKLSSLLSSGAACKAPLFVMSRAPAQAQLSLTCLQACDFAKVARKRSKQVLQFEVKKAENLEDYFDKLMRRRRENEHGVIDLPRRNFEDILANHVRTADDYTAMVGAFCNYVGHKNTFPLASTDSLLKKALAMQMPELAFDLIGNHAELLIHPQPRIVRSFMNQVVAKDDYDLLKSFFYSSTKGRYFLQRPVNLNRTVIEQAFKNEDKETVVDAYLDILDYEKELEGADASLFEMVLESMSYEEAIDHVLFGHVQEQMKARGFDCRLYSAIYFLNANGGLAAADLIKEMSEDASMQSLPKSGLFKTEFVEKVIGDENPLGLDTYVLEQVQLALKSCKDKLDADYYDAAAEFFGTSSTPEAESPEAEEQAEAGEEDSASAEEAQQQQQ